MSLIGWAQAWKTWMLYVYYLSSTLSEIDPDTAYVVFISVSIGFRQKPSDTALLSVIGLTTFKCIVSAPVTKGALVCFVVTMHWWRHRTHYDVTEAYRALCNILTVHLNNGATRADYRGIPKHCEVTAKAGRLSTIRVILMLFSLSLGMEKIHIRIQAFYGSGAVLGILNKLITWQVTSARLAGDVIQVWINSSPSNHCISHFKA